MGLGSRTARQHKTARAIDLTEGSTWDFQPGQRVMTVDGFPGVVAAVHDGPFQGNEEYEVTLDGGLGGGAYVASQLREISAGATATVHTAADDYPELGSILTERPDIAINTVLGSKIAAEMCPKCTGEGVSHYDSDWEPVNCDRCKGSGQVGDGEGLQSDPSRHASLNATAAEQTSVGLAPENAGQADYTDDAASCPDCGGSRMLTSADGTAKCENCGYLNAGDAQVGGEADDQWKTASKVANGDMQEARQHQKASDGATCKDCGFASVNNKPGDSCVLCDGQMSRMPDKWASKSWDLVVHAAESPSFLMAVTSSWSDVKAKAKRLRAEDGVDIRETVGGQVIAHVTGDHGTYETVLQHHLGANTGVSAWNCGCAWARYAWGRSGSYKRYEGRMCSHALATQLEALARGVFGDAHPENFGARVAASLASESPVAFLVQSSLAAGDEAAEVVLALRTAGVTNAQMYVHAASGDPSGNLGEETTGYGPTLGPTVRRNPNENPASAGWASGGDPENWAQDSSAFGRMGSLDEAWDEPTIEKEAVAPLVPLIAPIVRAVAPTVVKEVGKAVVKHKVTDMVNGSDKHESAQGQTPQQQAAPVGGQIGPQGEAFNKATWASLAELNDEPEAALPQTDGSEDETVEQIVASFQATAGQALMNSGSKGGDEGGMNVALAAKMALKDFSAAEQADLINEGSADGTVASNLDRLDIAGTHYEALEAALASAAEGDDLDL